MITMSAVKLSFGYDVERPYGKWASSERAPAMQKNEIDTCQKLNTLFNQEGVPRTFFVLGSFLERCTDSMSKGQLRASLNADNPLADIQQHSYSHQVIRHVEGSIDKTVMTPAEFAADLERANQVLEDILGVTPAGLRAPLGYDHDLSDIPEVVAQLQRLHFSYVSSNMRGTPTSYRAFLTTERQPHTYAHVGFPHVVEIPTHGWQDAIYTVEHAQKMLGTKPDSPDKAVEHYTELLQIAKSLAPLNDNKAIYVSLCLHPWAVAEYDPQLEVHKRIIDAARKQHVEIVSYKDVANEVLNQ